MEIHEQKYKNTVPGRRDEHGKSPGVSKSRGVWENNEVSKLTGVSDTLKCPNRIIFCTPDVVFKTLHALATGFPSHLIHQISPTTLGVPNALDH